MAADNLTIDLNADVGEGGAQDAALFAVGISSANVSCGAHAGDDATMAAACRLAARHDVALGAHPGFADREHFGRREMKIESRALDAMLIDQFRALRRHAGAPVRHVKPHGALYHVLNREAAPACAFVAIARDWFPGAAVFGPPDGELRAAVEAGGLMFVPEGFVDRAYRPDGTLVPRGEPGAVLQDESQAVAQALALARGGRVKTLCVHGDGPRAAALLAAVRAGLHAAGFMIAAPLGGRRG